MIFHPTPLPGVKRVEGTPHQDERGWFTRLWCEREVQAQGWEGTMAQSSLSQSRRAGTLRGLHFQKPPHEEYKLVRCVRGSIYDVAVDLRPDSPAYGKWWAAELTAANGRALLIPAGCAHGFQTLEDDTEVLYFISAFYESTAASGIRWDDPAFGISWPRDVTEISPADRSRADFRL